VYLRTENNAFSLEHRAHTARTSGAKYFLNIVSIWSTHLFKIIVYVVNCPEIDAVNTKRVQERGAGADSAHASPESLIVKLLFLTARLIFLDNRPVDQRTGRFISGTAD
jgi:hypothetical protein